MPAVGWLINGEKVTHAEAMSRSEADGHYYRFPPAVWETLWRQVQRVDGWVLPPSMTCPRLHILKSTEDYWLDPQKQWALIVGSAMHAFFEGAGQEGTQELKLETTLLVPITAHDGSPRAIRFPLRGTLDHYDPVAQRLTDYKSTSDFSYFDNAAKKRVAKEYPDPQHVQQINFYRLLLERNGYPVTSAQIWYFQASKDAPRKMVPVPLWGLDEVVEAAVEAARPLAQAQQTGEMPECACKFPGWGMDRNLCKESSGA